MKKKILITGGSGFIGTNLIEYLLEKDDVEIINLDIAKPKAETQLNYWIDCDILDKVKLLDIFKEHSPDIVIHLAAKADVEGKTLEDYKSNTTGTQNVVDAIKSVNSVKKVIITSTQFVNQYNGVPKNDEDYAPHTLYGESKVITEKITRSADLTCCWTIIRPTNIWGPWHWRYPKEFWKVLAEGKYIHPKSKRPVIRSYGYVENIVWQIFRILELDSDIVNRQVFYVGDKPVNIIQWANGFSKALRGKSIIVVPAFIIYMLGVVGDILKVIGINFPITTSRFKSMTTSNDAPMEKSFSILGIPPYNLEHGITRTVEWLKKYHPELIKLKK